MADDFDRVRAALSDVYAIDREIGRGGMATVYLANELKHHRTVAIKVLHPDIAASLGRERFLREIEIVANLRHRGILPLYDSGEADGLLFYVMPYVEGPTLRDRLAKEKQLPVDEALRITSELAAALDEAHSHGVIHRDIKPENVLFEGDQPLIADFGVATALEEAGGEKLTRTGVAVGTPSYMSPEQAAGGKADARSDEYALACVLYEMLGGTAPFTGPSAQAVMARHALDPVPDLTTVRSTLPEGVIAAVERAMAKVPADRYPSAGAFAEAIAKGDERRRRQGSSRISRKLALGVPTTVAVVVLLSLGIWRSLRSAVPAEASSMAVLPLAPAMEGDSVLAALGKQVGTALTYNLYQVGGIETQPSQTMLAAVGDELLTREEAAELAIRFGSSSVLTGTVEYAGLEGQLRATVQLLTSEGLSLMALASATASADSISVLANALTSALLREIWRKGRAPTPQVEAALGTDSLRALRKFLEGELKYAKFAPPAAAESYLAAFQIDSTFWLAAAMYATSWRWVRHSGPNEAEADPQVLAALREHVDELPEPQRSWVRSAAWRFGYEPDEFEPAISWIDLYDSYADLALEEKDFWPIVADYGDAVFHGGAAFGRPPSVAAEAIEQAIRLNPVLRESYIGRSHYPWVQPWPWDDADWQEAVGLADAMPDGGWRDSLPGHPWSALTLFCRSYIGVTADSTLTSPVRNALIERIWADDLGTFDGLMTSFISRAAAFLTGTPRCLVDSHVPALNSEPDPVNRAWNHLNIAYGWAGSGAWDSASLHIHEAARGADPTASLAAYRLAVAGAWLGFLDTRDVRDLRSYAERAARKTESQFDPDQRYLQAELAWLDGVLAVSEDDRSGLSQARDAIPVEDDWIYGRFRRSLHAYELAAKGDTAAAADSLYVVETTASDGGLPFLWTSSIFEEAPVFRPVNRLALSRLLVALGDTVRAEKILHWQESLHGPLLKTNGFAQGLAYLELARIHEAWGRPEAAKQYYSRFLRTDPIDDYAELGAEARAAVTRLDEELAALDTEPEGEPDD